MITLASDCLLFEVAGGESVPFSAEMITVELVGAGGPVWDEEFVRQAAKAVFHYFKEEMGRQTVTVGEFTGALEKALRGLDQADPAGVADLWRLACEAGLGGELSFFPRLREELRRQMRRNPGLVRFRGLRGCVRLLAGAVRWSRRCRCLEEQIVAYLRECLSAETPHQACSMLVE
jgi:hypothetical protein